MVAAKADGAGGNWLKTFANADDYQDSNGNTILTFYEAQDRARLLAQGGQDGGDDGKPITVGEAVFDSYRLDLEARGGLVRNADRLRPYISPSHADKPVQLLTARELRAWRDGMLKRGIHKKDGLAKSTVRRAANSFKAALMLAAAHDPRIKNRDAFRVGLAALPDSSDSVRNIILADADVLRIVAAAYAVEHDLGLLVGVLAVTGTRPVQARRLTCADLQADRADPRLLMPSSKKGRGVKKITRRPVPIPASLANALKVAAKGRPADAPLLTRGGARR